MTDREVTVKNLTIRYKVFGEGLPAQTGKPFLILHGWGSNASRWEKTAEIMSQNQFCVIVPDLPGFGSSSQPESAWSLDDYVYWLEEFCQKVPELNDTFYLLGHSFGGALASKFTIRYNQKVLKLFLFAAAAIRKKTLKKKVLGKISKAGKLLSFLPFFKLIRKAFYKFIVGGSDYIRTEGVMRETYLKTIGDDLSHKLSFLKVPVIILWGDKDDTTPMKDANWIHGKIFHSTLVVMPGADHAPYIHMPEILAQKILENV